VSRSPSLRRRGRVAWLYLAPAALVYIAFVLVPYGTTAWYSFFEWNGIGQSIWIGVDNYIGIFTNPDQVASLLHAIGLIFYFSVLPITFGLVLASVIAANHRRSWSITRAIIFLPQVLPLVAVAITWKWIYAQDGVLNQVLTAVGLGGATRAWLGDFTWAFPAVGFVGTWVCTGLCMVLFLSGIGKIDTALFEAVRLDGGGPVREFFTVTLPSLRGEITLAATVTVISALASFDIVYVMTRGGPGTSTMVPGVSIYNLAFSYGKVGEASALAVVLSLLVYLVVLVMNFLARSKD
jgi:raffinose/stachyose/melibiose transport system permease protein